MDTNVKQQFEQDNKTATNHGGPTANTPVQRLTATSIIGDRVENPVGETLGKITNLMVNVRDGSIDYVVLEMGSFLGLGNKLFAIPFTQFRVDPVKRVFILNRYKENLKYLRGFDKTHWPGTNAHVYYNEVETYWRTGNELSEDTIR